MTETNCETAFNQLWTHFLESSKGDFLDYNCTYSKYDFLRYLVDHKEVVLHGSPNFDIEVLEPRQATGTGPNQNLMAVYATTDAANAIFVAILDRTNINHWDFESPPTRYAIGLRDPSQSPWVDGVIYVLDRNFFQQRGNWVSTQAVFPIGKIKVCPQDFPLLDQVEKITVEENDSYHAAKSILCQVIDQARVTSRQDEQGYSVVVWNEESWIPLCRLHMTTNQKSMDLIDVQGRKKKFLIHKLEDIEKYTDPLQATASCYINQEQSHSP